MIYHLLVCCTLIQMFRTMLAYRQKDMDDGKPAMEPSIHFSGWLFPPPGPARHPARSPHLIKLIKLHDPPAEHSCHSWSLFCSRLLEERLRNRLSHKIYLGFGQFPLLFSFCNSQTQSRARCTSTWTGQTYGIYHYQSAVLRIQYD